MASEMREDIQRLIKAVGDGLGYEHEMGCPAEGGEDPEDEECDCGLRRARSSAREVRRSMAEKYRTLQKDIIFFGQPCTLACDGRCEKAWGIDNRPRVDLDPQDPDDYYFLADTELGEAPTDPGTEAGFIGKPKIPEDRLNRWCARECERSVLVDRGQAIVLPDFSRRRYNKPRPDVMRRHPREDS